MYEPGNGYEERKAKHIKEISAFKATLADIPFDEAEPLPIEIWPENYQAYGVFSALGTQWRIGMNGPTGLDYNVLPLIEKRLQVPEEDSADLFECLRIMENEALDEMRRQRDEQAEANKGK